MGEKEKKDQKSRKHGQSNEEVRRFLGGELVEREIERES